MFLSKSWNQVIRVWNVVCLEKGSGRFETPLLFVWGRTRGSVNIRYLAGTVNTANSVEDSACNQYDAAN
jgi:hypothetical protein